MALIDELAVMVRTLSLETEMTYEEFLQLTALANDLLYKYYAMKEQEKQEAKLTEEDTIDEMVDAAVDEGVLPHLFVGGKPIKSWSDIPIFESKEDLIDKACNYTALPSEYEDEG